MWKRMALIAGIVGSLTLTAQAQVAVPSLVVGAPRIFNTRLPIAAETSLTPENPAALMWGAPSRIGYGAILGKSSIDDPKLKGDVDGRYGGLRLVGDRIALGGEVASYRLDSIVEPVEEKTSSAQLAVRIPTWIAWGASRDTRRFERMEPVLPGNLPDLTEDTRSLVGISFRLGEHLFLGGAAGRETRLHSLPGGLAQQYERNVQMGGVGLRGGGGLIWHVEAYVIRKEDFDDPVTGQKFDGVDLREGTIELGFWDLVFGATAFTAKAPDPVNENRVEGFTVDYGYAPQQGLTISGRFEQSKFIVDGLRAAIEEFNSVIVAFQF